MRKSTEKLLVSPKDLKPSFPEWKVKGVFNPAAARLPNKKIVLIARVAEQSSFIKGKPTLCPVVASGKWFETRFELIHGKNITKEKGNALFLKNGTCRLKTFSHFKRIELKENGLEVERIEQKPFFTGKPGDGEYGVEDPRITKLRNTYAMTYVSVSLNEGVSTSLALSKDLVHWKRMGIIFRQQNKDVVLFPEKIKGKFVALHRPEGFFKFSSPSIWISYSPDLVFWGKEKSIVQTRENSWESARIGAGAPPIKTKEGWLEIYHGAKKTSKEKVYSAGALLLGLRNPEKILARSPSDSPLFSPTKKYEKKGYAPKVVFPTAAIPGLNKKDLLVYFGGADTVIGVKKVRVKDLLNCLE